MVKHRRPACHEHVANGGPVRRESAKITCAQRTSVASQSAIDCAVTAVTTTITVAAGVFAPGHRGERTRVVPFELADAVLSETRTRERRLRARPSRAGIYFVWDVPVPRLGVRRRLGRLTAGLGGLALPVPSAKALRDLRRRLGPAPLQALFEVLAGPLGQPRMPGVLAGRYRTVSFDGCKSVKVPDTERNRGWLGKLRASGGETGYPVIALMTLCETGTLGAEDRADQRPGAGLAQGHQRR